MVGFGIANGKSKKKGSLWDLYSHIIEGRILCKPDGTKGVVCCFKYHDYSMRFAAVYQVRWEHSRTSVDVPAHLVEQWCTDVFANETWVPKKIRAAQLANWHEDKVGGFMDSPLLKVHVRHHSESDAQPPPNKKFKANSYGLQQGVFVSPVKAGKPRNMAGELQQATNAHMAASRRNCRLVHHSPEHSGLEGNGHMPGEEHASAKMDLGEGGFLGQIKNAYTRLMGGACNGEANGLGAPGAAADSSTAAKKVALNSPARNDAKSPSAAAAAVHMGAATALLALQAAGKADGGSSKLAADGVASTTAGSKKTSTGGAKGSKASTAALKAEGAGDEEEWVPSWTGKVYPRSVCYRPGDKLVQNLTMDDMAGDFEVEHIVDEFVTKKTKWFLIKYKGYELRLGNGENDKGDWESVKNLKGTEAYSRWQKSKPAYFYQLTGAQTSKQGVKGTSVSS